MSGSELIEIVAVCAMLTLVLSMLIVLSQKWHGRLSHDHDLEAVQKVHLAAVPRVGGIAVVAGVLSGVVLDARINPGVIPPADLDKLLLLVAASLPAFAAGIVEDLTKTVSVNVRLFGTLCSALLASWLLGATVSEIDIWGVDALLAFTPLAVAITAVMVAGGANAINIIDGFNGLSAGVIAVISAAIGILSWQVGDTLVAMLCACGAGAALGFLLLNYPTGKLFLGDGGAYFLGFWVAEAAVLLLVRNPGVSAWQVLSICAYPVIEVLFSIYRRRFVKKGNAGAADALHLHTLIYRRLVSRLIAQDAAKPWGRNAAVACLVLPFVGVAAFGGATVASSPVAGFLLVTAQSALYVAMYRRLVRGRWVARPQASLLALEDANAKVL